jgi:hypothetical protein
VRVAYAEESLTAPVVHPIQEGRRIAGLLLHAATAPGGAATLQKMGIA